jgi:hypothetical protein
MYYIWIFCGPVSAILCLHMSIQINLRLIWKKSQLGIKVFPHELSEITSYKSEIWLLEHVAAKNA